MTQTKFLQRNNWKYSIYLRVSIQVKEISIRKKAADSKPQALYQDLGAAVLHAGILFQIFHHYHTS